MPPESQLMRPFQSRRTPGPHAWISVDQGIDVSSFTPALSPSDGERVPVRAGEGRSVASPGFHVSGCVRLGAAEITCLAKALAMRGIAEPSPFPARSIIPARKSNGISVRRWHSPSGSSDETSNANSDLRAGSGAAGRWLSVPQRGQKLQQRRWPQLLLTQLEFRGQPQL